MSNPWWYNVSSAPKLTKKAVRKVSLVAILPLVSVLTLIGGTAVYAIISPDPSQPTPRAFNSIENPANLDGIISKCGGEFTFSLDKKHYGLLPPELDTKQTGSIDRPEIPVQPMIVPVYGYMSEQGIDMSGQRVFNRSQVVPREQVLRSLYDGTVAIWYSPIANERLVSQLTSYVNSHPNTVLIPFKGSLPVGRAYAVSTWAASQSCDDYSLGVLDNFSATYSPLAPGRDSTPPSAPLNPQGKLYKIDLPER